MIAKRGLVVMSAIVLQQQDVWMAYTFVGQRNKLP